MRDIVPVGSIWASIYEHPIRTYALPALQYRRAARAFVPKHSAFVLSFFAGVRQGVKNFRVRIEGPHSSQTFRFTVGEKFERYEFVIENQISLTPLEVFLCSENALENVSELGILFFQLERGRIASSPIGEDIKLPAISNDKSEVGQTRAADTIALKPDVHNANSKSYSVTLVFSPCAEPWQYMDKDFSVFLRFSSASSGIDLSFGISGGHGAKFAVRSTNCEGKEEWHVSRLVAGKMTYAVTVNFDHGHVSFGIDGLPCLEFSIDEYVYFDHLGLSGSDRDVGPGYLIATFFIYEVPMNLFSIMAKLQNDEPEVFETAYRIAVQNFRYLISRKDTRSLFENVQQEEGFVAILRDLQYALPEVLEQYSHRSEFVEEDIRDWFFAHANRPSGINLSRETYTKTGRSDLRLSYADKDGSEGKGYHVEFKIWGRSGYKKLPEQPIKYMRPNEFFGVVVLIDRRKSECDDAYVKIVEDCGAFPCIGAHRVPIMPESGLNYFISFHQDANCNYPRMILHVILRIPNAIP
nr:hypothetical protein [uncultured Celeribacter sp.]